MKLYLSPSNQPANKYVVGNTNEKAEMEAVAAKVKTLLDKDYNIDTVMATLSLGIGASERPQEAKNKGCDFYLAIHSNAAGGTPPCTATGAVGFFHPDSPKSKPLMTAMVNELNAICPVKSNRASQVASGMTQFNGSGYGEIRSPMQKGVGSALIEVNFHDNLAAARWIIDNKDAIAAAIVKAIVSTFGITKKSGSTPVTPPASAKTPIMGKSECTAEQLNAYVKSKNPNAPEYGAIFIEEGNIEGVRGDIALCQSCLETGFFKFGGDVSASQNNFCGLGTTGGGVKGASFATPREGIRAQIQHLKAYASKDPLKQACVDPRFSLVTRGIAPNWEDLNGRWAVPGNGYGENIVSLWNAAKAFKVTVAPPITPPPPVASSVKQGDTVKLAANATYYDGKAIPDWVKSQNWIVSSVSGDRAVIDKNASGTSSINSPINTKFLTVVGTAPVVPPSPPAFQPYTVKVTASELNIRKGPGTNYGTNGSIKDKGTYTIVEEANGTGATKWGKLKSGAGWISLDYVQKK